MDRTWIDGLTQRLALGHWTTAIRRIFWAFFFLALPLSSFPYLPEELGGRALERPLAIYPLIGLALLVTLPRLLTRRLPRTLLPLLAFIAVALVGSLVAFGSSLDVYREVSLTDRFLRNVITLALGAAFYLTVTLLPESWDDLRFSLRWLYAGMGIALAWGSLQALYVIHYNQRYFRLLNEIQRLFSTRKLFTTRISGMTYEPKWFAEQICFLLMPWLIAAVLTRQTLFPRLRLKRWPWVTVELFLLLWSAGVLMFTFSRTGMFIVGVLIVLSFWLFRVSAGRPGKSAHRQFPKAPPKRMRRVLEVAGVTLALIVGLYVVGSQNAYFSRLWRYWTDGKTRSRTYLEYIAFDQRFVYWSTALRIYKEKPLTGVGLGNYAFYFADAVPDQPYDVQKEVMRQITPGEGRDRLITAKNLYARLIAETGLLGTGFFTAFLLAVAGCVLYLWFSPTVEQRFWALGGMLSLVVLSMVIFSFDSFARPNMWVALGLITAAAHRSDPPAGEPPQAETPEPSR